MNGQSSVDVAAAHWNDQVVQLQTRTVTRVRWWEDETTLRHINSLVNRSDSPIMHMGFHQRISQYFAGRGNIKAISVGCAMGTKELWLMQMIDIQNFDLYDISSVNIELGRAEALRQGFAGKTNFFVGNAFEIVNADDYDLVYWNNALHHMPDVEAAVAWSKDRLKSGGLFAMDDFVGPNRFQWSDDNLEWANKVRGALSDRLLENPFAPGTLTPKVCERPTIEAMIAVDPSEASDSGRIVESVKRHFFNSDIIFTGGALYHLALNDIFCNFKTDDDYVSLKQILLIDELLARNGITQYAVAFGVK